MSARYDPATVTGLAEEMQSLGAAEKRVGLPLAVHTGVAEGCKQASRAGARSLSTVMSVDFVMKSGMVDRSEEFDLLA